jgi:hypothetical protein
MIRILIEDRLDLGLAIAEFSVLFEMLEEEESHGALGTAAASRAAEGVERLRANEHGALVQFLGFSPPCRSDGASCFW